MERGPTTPKAAPVGDGDLPAASPLASAEARAATTGPTSVSPPAELPARAALASSAPLSSRQWSILLALGLSAYLIARLALATTPGYLADVGQFRSWSRAAADHGVARLYVMSDYDYPPLFAYPLWALGKLDQRLEPATYAAHGDSGLFDTLLKLPALAFDLLIAALLVWIARTTERADGKAAAPRPGTGFVIALAYLLNPAVLFDGGWWGQPDSIHSGLVLAAFVAMCGARRGMGAAAVAGALLALAALMKPLGAPYVPLLLCAALLLGRWRAVFAAIGGAAATTAVVFLPFVLSSGPATVMHRIHGDLEAMSYTSVQAHNLWWLVGPWRNADAAWLGAVTPKQFGYGLVAVLIVMLADRASQLHYGQRAGLHRSQVLAAAATLAFGFFTFSTHMHENHAFAAIPLLLGAMAAAPRGGPARRALGWIVAAATLGTVLNLAAHDPWLAGRWPMIFGKATVRVGEPPGHLFSPIVLDAARTTGS